MHRRHKPSTWCWQVVPSASELPLWGNENPGLLWLKAQFQYTHTEEVKSQNLLLTDPRKGVGQWAEEKAVLHPKWWASCMLLGWFPWSCFSMTVWNNSWIQSLGPTTNECVIENGTLNYLENSSPVSFAVAFAELQICLTKQMFLLFVSWLALKLWIPGRQKLWLSHLCFLQKTGEVLHTC